MILVSSKICCPQSRAVEIDTVPSGLYLKGKVNKSTLFYGMETQTNGESVTTVKIRNFLQSKVTRLFYYLSAEICIREKIRGVLFFCKLAAGQRSSGYMLLQKP